MLPKMHCKANADKKAAEKELENENQSSDTEEFLEEDTDAKLGKLIKNFSIAFSESATTSHDWEQHFMSMTSYNWEQHFMSMFGF